MDMKGWKDESYNNVIGSYNTQNLINQMASKYNTNTVLSRVEVNTADQTTKFNLEVGYNFAARCHLIVVYKTPEVTFDE